MSDDFFRAELERLEAASLRRRLRVLEGPVGPRMMLEGRPVGVWCGNDYLGLSRHPDLRKAAEEALRRHGAGSGAARLVSGSLAIHSELEAALAALRGTEDAVLFSSGYLANLGTIPALAGPEDLVLSDGLNHASLIDGIRLSRATVEVFRHGDAADAGRRLEERRTAFRRCLIVTDGLFSMEGDTAPLTGLARLAERHDALLYVDDAHATGVLGRTGAGSVEAAGLDAGSVAVQMGTLSKALGAEGGFVAGSRDLCEYVRNRARTFFFNTAPAPGTCGAALAALEIVRTDPARRTRLAANAGRLRRSLSPLGRVLPGEGPIVPVVLGSPEAAVAVSSRLERHGVLIPPIRPPTVPAGTSRLRATVSSEHGPGDFASLEDAVARPVREEAIA